MKTPLLVVIAYHPGDLDITKELLKWIVELGSNSLHSLLLAADSAVPQQEMVELMELAKPAFYQVRTMIIPVPPQSETQRVWPPNVMFLNAARQVQTNYKLPFFWMEPDCIPLCHGWLDAISEEYAKCAKRFMGPIVHQEGQVGLPTDHLTGCSVYPNDAWELIESVESVRKGVDAWDIGAVNAVLPKSAHTDLIQHFWGTKDMPPVFVPMRRPDDPKNFVTLDFVRKNAVVFHRSKDCGLIKLLRLRLNTPKMSELPNRMEPVPGDVIPPTPPASVASEQRNIAAPALTELAPETSAAPAPAVQQQKSSTAKPSAPATPKA